MKIQIDLEKTYHFALCYLADFIEKRLPNKYATYTYKNFEKDISQETDIFLEKMIPVLVQKDYLATLVELCVFLKKNKKYDFFEKSFMDYIFSRKDISKESIFLIQNVPWIYINQGYFNFNFVPDGLPCFDLFEMAQKFSCEEIYEDWSDKLFIYALENNEILKLSYYTLILKTSDSFLDGDNTYALIDFIHHFFTVEYEYLVSSRSVRHSFFRIIKNIKNGEKVLCGCDAEKIAYLKKIKTT